MATATTTTSLDSKPAIKRPVAQRNDSSIEVHDSSIKRRPRVIEKRSHNDNGNKDKDQTNSQQQSRLFRLPYELRLMIYEFALPTPAIPTLFSSSSSPFEDASSGSSSSSSSSSSDTTTPPSSPSHAIIDDPAAEPPFLQTCRLARLEGLSVFYRHNDFLLNRRPSLDFQHPLLMSMMTPTALLSRNKKGKRGGGGRGNTSKWLYAMSDIKITQIQSVVFAQLGRGMYKETASGNEWRRDASACFRVRLLPTICGGGRGRRRGRSNKFRGRDYEIEYLKIDETGKSDRYAERLVKALETRMEQLAEKGVREWSRQDIWDLAYLL